MYLVLLTELRSHDPKLTTSQSKKRKRNIMYNCTICHINLILLPPSLPYLMFLTGSSPINSINPILYHLEYPVITGLTQYIPHCL